MGKAKRLKQRKQWLRAEKRKSNAVELFVESIVLSSRCVGSDAQKIRKFIKSKIVGFFQDLITSSRKEAKFVFVSDDGELIQLGESWIDINDLGGFESFDTGELKPFAGKQLLDSTDFKTERVIGFWVSQEGGKGAGCTIVHSVERLKADLAQFMSEQGGHQM